MTVKDRVGRGRHVVFRVEAERPLSRQDVADALRAALGGADVRVTRYDGALGVVRVPHRLAAEARRAFPMISRAGRDGRAVRVETLGTSGTLRGAVENFAPTLTRAARRPRERSESGVRSDRAL